MTNNSSVVRKGYLYAFLAALCGGAIPTLSKLALLTYGPAQVSALAFLLSGLMLLPLKARQRPSRKSFKFVLFFGLLGAALAPVIYQTGLNATTAVNASLLSNGEALFTTVIAFAAFGERLLRKQLAVGLLIVAGIVIVSTNLDLGGVQFIQGLAGNVMILGSMFFWSVENNLIISATQRFGPLMLTKFRNIIGGGAVALVIVVVGLPLGFSLNGLVYIVLLAVSLAATSYFAIASLGIIGAIRAILVFSTGTIFGALFALAILREQITPVQLIGGAFILVGVYLLQRFELPLDRSAPAGDMGR